MTTASVNKFCRYLSFRTQIYEDVNTDMTNQACIMLHSIGLGIS